MPATPEPHLFDRLSVLYKYRWAAIGVFLAVVAWVMVDSYTRLPIYRATARVLIEDANNDIATPSEISRPVNMVDPEIYMQTQLRIIRGRDLSQRVAKKLDLDKVAEFNGQGPKPTQLARGIATVKYYVMWPYRLITSSSSAPSVLPPSVDDVDTGDLAQRLMGRVGVAQVRGSQLVDLTYDGPDPVFAARAVNTYADEYVSENLSLKVQTLEKSAEWLSGEVERQGRLVQQSELALAQYREKQDAGALDSSQNIVVARLTAAERGADQGAHRAHPERKPVAPDPGRGQGRGIDLVGHRQSGGPEPADAAQ